MDVPRGEASNVLKRGDAFPFESPLIAPERSRTFEGDCGRVASAMTEATANSKPAGQTEGEPGCRYRARIRLTTSREAHKKPRLDLELGRR
jgi:hypothetical protein